MKKIVSLLIWLIPALTVYTQSTSKSDSSDINKVKEPEYNDVFFLLDTASGDLIALERQTLEVKVRSKGVGAESDLELKGGKSPLRFKRGQRLEFVVRVASPETDPQGYLLLYSLEAKKNERVLAVAKAGYMGTNRRTVLDKSAITFNATKYGVSSFKIKTIQDLPAGEYLLLTKDARDGFAFGID